MLSRPSEEAPLRFREAFVVCGWSTNRSVASVGSKSDVLEEDDLSFASSTSLSDSSRGSTSSGVRLASRSFDEEPARWSDLRCESCELWMAVEVEGSVEGPPLRLTAVSSDAGKAVVVSQLPRLRWA